MSTMMQSRITKYFYSPKYEEEDTEFVVDPIFDQFSSQIPNIIKSKPLSVTYMHKSVRLVYLPNKDYYGVYAAESISKGSVLVIENSVVDTTPNLITYLEQNPNIASEMYPRKSTISYKEKIINNIWEWYDKGIDPSNMKSYGALFEFLSKINHSCTPNCFVIKEVISNTENNYHGCFVLIATENIPKGKEILLSYGPETGHGHEVFDWQCNCLTDYKDRNKLFYYHGKVAMQSWNLIRKLALKTIYKL
jgi:hypothetical protein